jgi:hypothetical protein
MLRRVTGEVERRGGKTVSPGRSRITRSAGHAPFSSLPPGPGPRAGSKQAVVTTAWHAGIGPDSLYVEVTMETDDHSLEFAGGAGGPPHLCAFSCIDEQQG